MGFHEAPTDLATHAPSFGAAHLFIDGGWDCDDFGLECWKNDHSWSSHLPRTYDGYCWNWASWACQPCQPPFTSYGDAKTYWNNACNDSFAECNHGDRFVDFRTSYT